MDLQLELWNDVVVLGGSGTPEDVQFDGDTDVLFDTDPDVTFGEE